MRHYLQLSGIDPFIYLPLTFHIKKGQNDPQFSKFKKKFQQLDKQRSLQAPKNLWIIKPGQNSNRGNGITVAHSFDDIIIRIRGKQKNSDGGIRSFILQKYIQKPLLYQKRKFDIRHFILVTCVNGIFKGYWHQQGYIRTSSVQFSYKYSKDPFMHLTNDAIQKNGQNYGKYQKGNKVSYSDIHKYIQNNHKGNFFGQILPKMKQIALIALKSTYLSLSTQRYENNFQLFGLDFMIDSELKPQLIQVNSNPCLQLGCNILQKIIPSVVQGVFKICLDPIFPPPQNWTGKRMIIGDQPITDSRFTLFFNQIDDGFVIQKIYQNSPKLDQNMGKIQQQNDTFDDDGQQDWETREIRQAKQK